jgi:hypothetical protein
MNAGQPLARRSPRETIGGSPRWSQHQHLAAATLFANKLDGGLMLRAGGFGGDDPSQRAHEILS